MAQSLSAPKDFVAVPKRKIQQKPHATVIKGIAPRQARDDQRNIFLFFIRSFYHRGFRNEQHYGPAADGPSSFRIV